MHGSGTRRVCRGCAYRRLVNPVCDDVAPPDKWGSENIPLKRDQNELLGQRFIREKLPANADAVSFRALGLFAAECRAKGGKMEPQEGPVTARFATRVFDGVPLRSSAKEQWRASVALCSRDADPVLGGFVAIVHDTTGIARRGDIGSRLMMRIANVPTGSDQSSPFHQPPTRQTWAHFGHKMVTASAVADATAA